MTSSPTVAGTIAKIPAITPIHSCGSGTGSYLGFILGNNVKGYNGIPTTFHEFQTPLFKLRSECTLNAILLQIIQDLIGMISPSIVLEGFILCKINGLIKVRCN